MTWSQSSSSNLDNTIFILLGKTGAGKSAFINRAVGKEVSPVGHGLTTTTFTITAFQANHPKHPDKKITLVDTPGLGTGAREDYKIMKKLVKWLKESIPEKSRKVIIIYLVAIDRKLSEKSEVYMFPKKLIMHGVSTHSLIVTTKWENLYDMQLGHERRELISGRFSVEIPVHAFQNSGDSAWNIIDSVHGEVVDMSQFRLKLSGVLPRPPILDRLWSLLGFGSKTEDAVTHTSGLRLMMEAEHEDRPLDVLDNPVLIARLREVSTKLGTAFSETQEYRKLLACQGREAQALLDTFQSILRADLESGHRRRNLIYATKRLSVKSGLYPSPFILDDVEPLDEQAVASGAFADIRRGKFQGQLICLKVLRVFQKETYDKVTKAIAREGILWGQLSHPNLLPFWGIFKMNGQLSLVSPWVENGNVVEYIKSNPECNRLLLCADVADGIGYLHENEIIHGDLKGMNILVDDLSGRACVADFGLSSISDPDILHWASQSAAAGGRGGTARWQGPELFAPESDEDSNKSGPTNTKATDIYAWSCICLEIFTGHAPFHKLTQDYLVIRKVSEGARPGLPENEEPYISMGLSSGMRRLMNDCWEHDPRKRPDCSQVLRRFEVMKPQDRRPLVGWKLGPAMRKDNLSESDAPLTLKGLEEILQREPPPHVHEPGKS